MANSAKIKKIVKSKQVISTRDSAKSLRVSRSLYWRGLDSPSNQSIGEGEYFEKVFKWSEVRLSEMTCSKIHALNAIQFLV